MGQQLRARKDLRKRRRRREKRLKLRKKGQA